MVSAPMAPPATSREVTVLAAPRATNVFGLLGTGDDTDHLRAFCIRYGNGGPTDPRQPLL